MGHVDPSVKAGDDNALPAPAKAPEGRGLDHGQVRLVVSAAATGVPAGARSISSGVIRSTSGEAASRAMTLGLAVMAKPLKIQKGVISLTVSPAAARMATAVAFDLGGARRRRLQQRNRLPPPQGRVATLDCAQVGLVAQGHDHANLCCRSRLCVQRKRQQAEQAERGAGILS